MRACVVSRNGTLVWHAWPMDAMLDGTWGEAAERNHSDSADMAEPGRHSDRIMALLWRVAGPLY